MNRLWIALGAYAVLAILTMVTIDEQKYKLAALAILAMFAIRTLTWSRKMERDKRDGRTRNRFSIAGREQSEPVCGRERSVSPRGFRESGSNSVVESQPSKLLVAGSIPVSRSRVCGLM